VKRRTFLKAIAASGAWTIGTARLRGAVAAQSRGQAHPGLLDRLRDKIHTWTESLWDDARGGFRQNAEIGVNLMSTTDVAWLRYAVNDPDLAGGHRDAWVRWLQQAQDPKTGIVRYNPADGGLVHSDGHALWHTVRALNILGGQLLHFPHYLRGVMTAKGLAAWFDSIDWDSGRSNHHEVLGLVPLLANLNDPEWADTLYGKIAEQQNPQTGGFPRSKLNISRTFAYTALHRATDRMPPHAEKIVDLMLAAQQPDGFWQGQPAFYTMDAAFILLRLPPLLSRRQDESRRALQRLADALAPFYRENQERLHQHTHRVLAIVHTFGLLQEAFPDRFPSERPFRFDWDKPSMYRCDVIRREVKQ
jgi:hypothetical protein